MNALPPSLDSMTDKEYLRAVHMLPCCICDAFDEHQVSRTQAHHPICARYSGKKRPDKTAIPLCEGHHQGLLDTSKIAIHRGKQTWVNRYGSDTDWIAVTQDKVEGLTP